MSTDGPPSCATVIYTRRVKYVSILLVITLSMMATHRPLSKNCDFSRIATECSNVCLNPVQRKSLIVVAEIHESFIDEAGA